MMRSGYLLAEGSPQSLLISHNLRSLEDVFLKLCLKDDSNNDDRNSSFVQTTSNNTVINRHNTQQRQQTTIAGIVDRETVENINPNGRVSIDNSIEPKKRRNREFHFPSPHRTLALLHKNYLQTFRNIG